MCFFTAAALGTAGAATAVTAGSAATAGALSSGIALGTAGSLAVGGGSVFLGTGAVTAATVGGGAAAASTAAAGTALTAGGLLGSLSNDIALLSTGLSIASSVETAKQQEDAADFNEKAAKVQAANSRSVASRRAGKITAQAQRFASGQRAALGSSGFDVNRGDAVSIVGDTLRRGALDASAAIESGNFDAAASLIRAQNARIAGRSARNVATGQITGTVLGASGAVANNWYRFHS